MLLGGSFIGSFMTAAVGVGGGSFLILVMATIMPPAALVPIHGFVQLGSNASRAWLTKEHTNKNSVLWFMVGAAVATVVSVWLVNTMDARWIPLIVAGFILYLSWLPLPDIGLSSTKAGLVSGGLFTTVATMLVGASGPLVAAWLRTGDVDRWQYTATFSTCMVLQHVAKLIVFGIAGFAFFPWLLLIAAMIVAGYLGTQLGLLVLGKLPDKALKPLFRWVLTLLAIKILWGYL